MASRREMYEDSIKKIRPYIKAATANDFIRQLLGGTFFADANTNTTDLQVLNGEATPFDPIVDLINGGYGIQELLQNLKNTQTIANVSSFIRITTPQILNNVDTNPNILNNKNSYSGGSINPEKTFFIESGFTENPFVDFSFGEGSVGTKEKPIISVIEMLNNKIGTAVRDTVGVSIFTSMIPPHIISRAVPYVSLKIASPTSLSKSEEQTVADNLSIIRYLKGRIPWQQNDINSLQFAINGSSGLVPKPGGMELFTSPQTMVSDINDLNGPEFSGVSPIDRFRPLMTLTSMNLQQVSAGAGMISYKQGDLEFILHDRGRLSEISQFVKPGVFANTEIEIEYGWSIDPNSGANDLDKLSIKDDIFSQFVDSLKIVEKYIIVNSTFNFDDAGQVNIKCTIAMKGASDTRSLDLSSIATESKKNITAALKDIQKIAFNDEKKIVADILGESVLNAVTTEEAVLNVDSDKLAEIRAQISKINGAKNKNSDDLTQMANLLDDLFKEGGAKSTIEKEATEYVDKIISSSPIGKEIFFATEEMLKTGKCDKNSLISNKNFKASMDDNDYAEGSISLGRLLLTVLGIPLSKSKSFDEIHFVFNKLNDRAGFVRGLSLAAFPLDRKRLKADLTNLFKKNTKVSLANFSGLLGVNHVNSMTYPCYGFAAAYNEKGELENSGATKIDSALSAAGINDTNFVQPKLVIVPECIPGVDDKSKTILRIHVSDATCQPFLTYAEAISSMRSDTSFLIDMKGLDSKHPLFSANYPNYLNPETVSKERTDTIKKLIDADVLVPVSGSTTSSPDVDKPGSYSIDLTQIFKGDSPKKVRNFMSEALPIIRYGSAYGLVKNISVSSISDANLATINIIKADEAQGSSEGASKKKGLPLIVNPTEISVEMMGCPLVNFGQSFYVDLGTNTSADNIYSCVDIQHKISPGDFSTSLKLVMNVGAYGIYNSNSRKIEITKKLLNMEAATKILTAADANRILSLIAGDGELASVDYDFFKKAPPKTTLIRLWIKSPSGYDQIEYLKSEYKSFYELNGGNADKLHYECYEFPVPTMNASCPQKLEGVKFFNDEASAGFEVQVDMKSVIEEINLKEAAGRKIAAKKKAASAATNKAASASASLAEADASF